VFGAFIWPGSIKRGRVLSRPVGSGFNSSLFGVITGVQESIESCFGPVGRGISRVPE
jgi:hypothetical protein